MYRWDNNGGWNKSHDQIEKTPRIDSFDSAISEGCGSLFVCADGITKLLDFDRYGPRPEDAREIMELWAGEWSQTVELSQKINGYGGQQTFFLCPACGARRRFLYLTGGVFLCRKCARLNYRSQQETRSGNMYYYDKGMALVEKHLDTWPWFRPDGFSFCDWVPDRPPEICGAVEDVELCTTPGVSWNIMGVVAQDKRFEDMLNKLLDDDN